jgi:hypothetical protein
MVKPTKGKKFAVLNIRKITGGKDPLHLVEEFIMRHGFDPDACQQHKSPDNARWMLPLGNEEELEILVEALRVPSETTIYMGLNVVTVPVRGTFDLLTVALQIADGLVGIKVSLVGHYLVLSASLGAAGMSVDDLDYHFSLITAQQAWFRETLAEELGWETIPEE